MLVKDLVWPEISTKPRSLDALPLTRDFDSTKISVELSQISHDLLTLTLLLEGTKAEVKAEISEHLTVIHEEYRELSFKLQSLEDCQVDDFQRIYDEIKFGLGEIHSSIKRIGLWSQAVLEDRFYCRVPYF
jgi:hypothetical protein